MRDASHSNKAVASNDTSRSSSKSNRRFGQTLDESSRARAHRFFIRSELEAPDVQTLKDEILVVGLTSLHPAVFATVALSAAITALLLYVVKSDSIWLGYLSSAKPAINILGSFLGFSLAFRINICCEYLQSTLLPLYFA